MLYTAYIIFFVKNFGYSLEYPCIHARPGPWVPPWERIPTKQQLVLPQWRTRTLCNLQCRIGITGPPKHPEKPCYICMQPMMLSTLGGSIHVHAHACLPQGSQSSIIFPSACYFCQRFLATFCFHDAVQWQQDLGRQPCLSPWKNSQHSVQCSSNYRLIGDVPASRGRATATACVLVGLSEIMFVLLYLRYKASSVPWNRPFSRFVFCPLEHAFFKICFLRIRRGKSGTTQVQPVSTSE